MLATLALGIAAPVLTLQSLEVDLTPPAPLPLGGYTARGGKPSEPEGEPLQCRTVLLSQGGVRLAVVSCDLLTIPESLVREVRRKVGPGISIFLSATHTHCAPDSQMLNDRMTFALPGIAKHDPAWLEWYAERIASCIRQSSEAPRTPVGRLLVSGRNFDGNRGRRLGARPIRTAYEVKSVDPDSANLAIRPLWFWYSAHAVFHGPERNRASGDWPGQSARHTGCPVALMGPIGDVSPAGSGETSDDRIRDFWARYRAVRPFFPKIPGADALHWPAEPFRIEVEPIRLPERLHSELFASQNRIPPALAAGIVQRFAPREASVTAFRLGKLAVVGIPGEPTSALGRRIRDEGRRQGFEIVLPTSHVNGWIGYLLEADDYARGGYEASLDFYGPEAAQRVFEAAKAALKRLAASVSAAAA